MRIPECLRLRLYRALRDRVIRARKPDQAIGGAADPYMERWWLTPWSRYVHIERPLRTRWQRLVCALPLPAVYLHRFHRSDDDRALHDHPWRNASALLSGTYTEHTIAAGGVHHRAIRVAGDIVARPASAAHRIELHAGPCISLFLTGPRTREWGFHCPHGWRHWREFTNPADGGATIGRGCE